MPDNELIDCSPGACCLMMSCSAIDVGACTVPVFDATSCIIEPPADSPCSDAHADPPFLLRLNLLRMACIRTVVRPEIKQRVALLLARLHLGNVRALLPLEHGIRAVAEVVVLAAVEAQYSLQ